MLEKEYYYKFNNNIKNMYYSTNTNPVYFKCNKEKQQEVFENTNLMPNWHHISFDVALFFNSINSFKNWNVLIEINQVSLYIFLKLNNCEQKYKFVKLWQCRHIILSCINFQKPIFNNFWKDTSTQFSIDVIYRSENIDNELWFKKKIWEEFNA